MLETCVTMCTQAMDLSALKTYAVICDAEEYKLLLYDPGVNGRAKLYLSDRKSVV